MLCIRVCACVCVQLNLEAKGLHLMMDPRDGYQVTPLDKVRRALPPLSFFAYGNRLLDLYVYLSNTDSFRPFSASSIGLTHRPLCLILSSFLLAPPLRLLVGGGEELRRRDACPRARHQEPQHQTVPGRYRRRLLQVTTLPLFSFTPPLSHP